MQSHLKVTQCKTVLQGMIFQVYDKQLVDSTFSTCLPVRVNFR